MAEDPHPFDSPALVAGQRLGPYEVVALIGRGGMGEVYRARDTRLGRHVAIKVLPHAAGGSSAAQRTRFEAEARAASALNHPNVLTVYDVGVTGDDQDSTFIVMELLEGETLRDRLVRDPRLPRELAVDYAGQVARGLTAAHAAGIVHRDLKPENLFVTDDNRVKILDFGLAKLTRAEDVTRAGTQPGVVMGTVGYMAPEQVRGEVADHRSDIFAFGTVLFEMLVGRRAFGGRSPADTMSAVLNVDPLQEVPASGRDTLFALIRGCLAKNAEDRYQRAADVVAALGSTSAVAAAPTVARPRWTHVAAASLAVIVAVVIAWTSRRATPISTVSESREMVLAVLPFDNISEDQSQQYFTTGVTEEIGAHLARVSSLRLMSRGAVERYGRTSDAPRRMRQELAVSAVLTGSVRLAGGRARISVQLVDTRTEQAIWAQQYDARLDDILQLQSDVARQITTALQARLTGNEQSRMAQPATKNATAYELYLKAKGPRVTLQAIEMLKEAVRLDPKFGAAYARLSLAQGQLGMFGDHRLFDDALESARRAVEVDPNEARGHHALAQIQLRRGRLVEARVAFLRALELAPNYAEAAWDLSITDATLGHFDESLFWARRGFVLAPNVSTAYYHLGIPLVSLADANAAERWLLEAEARFPAAPRVQYLLSENEFLAGNEQGAESRIRRALAAGPDNEEVQVVAASLAFLRNAVDAPVRIESLYKRSPDARTFLLPETFRALHAYLRLRAGDAATGTRLLDEALRAAHKERDDGSELAEASLEIAAIHALRGERADALEWVAAAHKAGWRLFRELDHDPFFSTLRNDPEFLRIRRLMEDDVTAMRQRVNVNDNPALPPVAATPPGPPKSAFNP